MPDRHSELVEEAARLLAIRRLEGARWKQYRPDAQAAAKPFLEELEQLRARAERAEERAASTQREYEYMLSKVKEFTGPAYWDTDTGQQHKAALTRAERYKAALEEIREAAKELLRLKDGPRDDAYRAAKGPAWDRLRALTQPQEKDTT